MPWAFCGFAQLLREKTLIISSFIFLDSNGKSTLLFHLFLYLYKTLVDSIIRYILVMSCNIESKIRKIPTNCP